MFNNLYGEHPSFNILPDSLDNCISKLNTLLSKNNLSIIVNNLDVKSEYYV